MTEPLLLAKEGADTAETFSASSTLSAALSLADPGLKYFFFLTTEKGENLPALWSPLLLGVAAQDTYVPREFKPSTK